jgi:uncharacterized membrane protein YciS (DUF1049 family)
MIIILIILIIFVIEIKFRPRLDITRNNDLLIHYNYKNSRNYIRIKI